MPHIDEKPTLLRLPAFHLPSHPAKQLPPSDELLAMQTHLNHVRMLLNMASEELQRAESALAAVQVRGQGNEPRR